MTDFIIAPSAIKDLDQISEYYLTRNVEAGEKLLQEFQQKCRYLVKFPNIGRPLDYLKPGLRGLQLKKYIILYEIIEDRVTILRVISSYRNLESLFAKN